ncbi:hypothetical protein [Pseudobutyrivibrio xylanivorans]|uniref:Uncharacterized protein n=1 Tax=Pseudobutyrivibrio xylanivorans TaxID=185007 RepID=A0A5P6VU56_PSEXY|nr:hypothetical protein [Pseudobutyrivibrio xylanivorans]QFJ55970.1 hypothetical protein FXF36_14255 [Pseudobutyrivibrio xylanivorans]
MIKDGNIIDLSDFAERDVKEELAHIKESIISLEKLIDAKEQEPEDSTGNSLARKLKATIRENIEELNLPIEEKCDALEAKLNVIQESISQMKEKQAVNSKIQMVIAVGMLVVTFINLYIFFFIYM